MTGIDGIGGNELSSMSQPWRFYGRQAELQSLDQFVNGHAPFSVLAIYGRRNVGKTDLIHTYIEQNAGSAASRHVIVCEFLRLDTTSQEAFNRLLQAVQRTAPKLVGGFQNCPSDDKIQFSKLAEHLLRQGCIVVLDEFQRIRATSGTVESEVQFLIDRLRRESRKQSTPKSRLIFMGSEQQRLVEMFKHPTAPMFNRVDEFLHVKPWTFTEFKEMVINQGWEHNPHRLLTLWAAYNGLPGHWERFWREGDLSDFSRIRDDTEWTRQFLAAEEQYRTSPGGEFNDQLEVELRPSDQRIMRWLSQKPNGWNISEAFAKKNDAALTQTIEGIRSTLQKEYPEEDLTRDAAMERVTEAIVNRLSSNHLGLLEKKQYLDDDTDIKWRVCDAFARFQLQVLEIIANETIRMDPDTLLRSSRKHIQRIEGYGLESLCQEALRQLTQAGCQSFPAEDYPYTLIYANPEIKNPKQAEFDALVRVRPAADSSRSGHLWILSAKRSVQGHDIAREINALDRFFVEPDAPFIATMFEGADPLSYQRHFVFVSPRLSDAQRTALLEQSIAARREGGNQSRIDYWYAMDIADMITGRGPQRLIGA
ncbi:MAG: ATP-binding protein [Aestuariivita sp.]|nr:ATP-binding protein [Aestuariivita sp.]MCY4202546.1 ATP-binding protein [Aestuariivita sp.]MCY4287433.1 ATP-binding protein [Aestuariivita sp.]MCY4347267.1 ATP-binding protein [Aestuariivita sp.]